jgi:hypothetical protein
MLYFIFEIVQAFNRVELLEEEILFKRLDSNTRVFALDIKFLFHEIILCCKLDITLKSVRN